MSRVGSSLVRARSIDHACTLLADGAVLLAGGTDLVVESHLAPPKPAAPPPRALVDISSLVDLTTIELRDDEQGAVARIGAGVTYLALRRGEIANRIPLLAAMSKDVGAIQIQARGTLGGNLATASPAADGVCALAALDATIGLRSVRGAREVPLRSFYKGYKQSERAKDEIITHVDVRIPGGDAIDVRWSWRKVGTRLAQAISKVAFAAVVELRASSAGGSRVEHRAVSRVGFGMASVAPTTALLPSVVKAIDGKTVEELTRRETMSTIDDAVDADIAPIDDVRSTARYRRHVAKALVRELVRSLAR